MNSCLFIRTIIEDGIVRLFGEGRIQVSIEAS